MSHELAYVALSTSDPEGLASVLAQDLGMTGARIDHPGGPVHLFAAGRSGVAVFGNDHSLLDRPGVNGVDHIGLAAADPVAAAQASGLAAAGKAGMQGLGGGVEARLDPAKTRGLNTRFVTAPALPTGAPAGMIERIDHLGVASAGVREDEAVFCGRLGFQVESRQTDMEVMTAVESFTSDKYGVIYHNRPPVPQGGLRVLFVTVGDTDLEFLQEFAADNRTVDHGGPGTTKQDQGAIGRYIEKRGAGLHHIALKTKDINATLARLGERGRRLIDRTGRPGSRRAQIGFVHPAALGGVLLHFVEREELP